ncbi:E3 ubiquitin-protein ligase [Sergentomyia squamirostris]
MRQLLNVRAMETTPDHRSSSRSSTSSPGASDCAKNTISLKHYDCLLGELRCPGCANPMYAPIFLCQSGHSVCQVCVNTLTSCPLCHRLFTEMRSITIEAISAKAFFSCKNTIHGCSARLPYELMKWHKPRCLYQTGSCFMGTIWGGCSWFGRKLDYHEHCAEIHADKVHMTPEADLTWSVNPAQKESKSVVGVFMFNVHGEIFDLYQVYDRTSTLCLWTMVCESKERKACACFAFQIELHSQEDPTKLLVQRHSCHAELDEDLLDEAHCVTMSMGDIMRFMEGDKTVHFKVKILDLRESKKISTPLSRSSCETCPPKTLPDIQPEPIECGNHKCIPAGNIITKKCSKEIKGIKDKPQKTTMSLRQCLTEVEDSLNGSISSLDYTDESTILTDPMKVKMVNGGLRSRSIDVSNRDLKAIFDKEFHSRRIK